MDSRALLSAATPSFPPKSSPTKTAPPSLHPKKQHTPPPKPPKSNKPLKKPSSPSSLHSKNPHAICRDLQRLARLDRLPESLSVLDHLSHLGVPVNPTTFSALLSAASRLRSLPLTRQLHAHLRINSLHHNPFLLSKLIHAYTSCNSPGDARAVLQLVETKTAHPWNALLKGHVASGRRWSLLPISVFNEMRELGVELNEYTFSCLIKSLAGSPAFYQGTKAHAILVKNGLLHSSVHLRTGLVDMYFKCGRTHMAMKLFDEIPERDVVLWGTVIAGFAHNGMRREALEYFRRMGSQGLEPNSVVVTSVLPVIGELSERKLGQEIHGFVMKHFREYRDFVSIQSGLIDMYCKCGDMVSGRHVFYGSNERNVVSWTALMSGYAANGRLEQALRSIIWMQQEGVKPDVVTIATVLPVCSQLKALRQGKEIHGHVLKNWFLPNISVSTSLMTMYSECGRLESSIRVFDGMVKKNVIAWTALIDSYAKNGRRIDALEVFRVMRVANHRLDAIAIARVSSISGDLGLLKFGKEVHGQVYKIKLEDNPFVMAETVKMYGKCGDTEKARKVFDGIRAKGSLTWTAIIEAYDSNGQYREAIKLFDDMLSNGFIPNHFTFDAALAICDKAGLHKEALRVFDSMVLKYKLKASEEHCNCMISLLARAGRISEAQRFVYLKSTLVQL